MSKNLTMAELAEKLSNRVAGELPNLPADLRLEFQFCPKKSLRARSGTASAAKYFRPEKGDEIVFRFVETEPLSARRNRPVTSAPRRPRFRPIDLGFKLSEVVLQQRR